MISVASRHGIVASAKLTVDGWSDSGNGVTPWTINSCFEVVSRYDGASYLSLHGPWRIELA